MTLASRFLGAIAGVAACWGMAVLSDMPLAQAGARESRLRLTWRARPERVERCEEQDPEVLKRVPAHMRQPVTCEGAHASYQLEVWRGDEQVLAKIVRPGGLRQDRPLYVFEELAMPAGSAEIRVTFTRVEDQPRQVETGNAATDRAAEHARADEASRRQDEFTEVVPPQLAYTAMIGFRPGEIRVVSYDPERRVLFEVRP